MTVQSNSAVVLLSGGLDSATALAVARAQGFDCYALTMRYGQRHGIEVEKAQRLATVLGAAGHVILDIDLRRLGGSALTADMDVPKARSDEEISQGIPITYVPARNTIFLSYALAWSEILGGRDIFIGVNALDYSGYPDCRPEFIERFEAMAAVATKAGVEGQGAVRIHTPLIDMKKSEIIKKGTELNVDFALTSSCYDPDAHGVACGQCDACLLRLKGFAEAGLEDPIPYRSQENDLSR